MSRDARILERRFPADPRELRNLAGRDRGRYAELLGFVAGPSQLSTPVRR